MILYVNGDSHSAGAEAVNTHAFANDDRKYVALGRRPHPENLKVSYGQLLADRIGAELVCEAESGSSNQRILRTTYSYLEKNRPNFIIIGWATWEREEIEINGKIWQFSAGWIPEGWPPVPYEVKEYYKNWVINRTNPQIYCDDAQVNIYKLHQTLEKLKIPHLFFNTYSNLTTEKQLNWQNSYFKPYDSQGTYYKILKDNGCVPTNLNTFHFGPDGHKLWADILQPILTKSL